MEDKIEFCESTVIHEEVIDRVKDQLPQEEEIRRLADFYKMFSDYTRARILIALGEAEMCVCDIAALLDMSQSSISHQLRKLKQARLVKNRRDGKVVYYSLDDQHIVEVLAQGLEHVREENEK